MSDLNPALETYAQESEELLMAMEEALLKLENTPGDQECINSIFRAMHTIKGTSGLFGFDAIVAFTHEAETVLDKVRNGERDIDPELISVLLEIKDHTSKMIQHMLSNADQPLSEALLAQGEALIQRLTGKPTATEQSATSPAARAPHPSTATAAVIDTQQNSGRLEIEREPAHSSDHWLITLKFKRDALRNGMDPLSFLRYLKSLGTIVEVITTMPDVSDGEAMDPESCYLHFTLAFQSDADKKTIESVFEFAEDDCDISILPPHSKQASYLSLLEAQPEDHVQRLGDMLVAVGALTEREVQKALALQAASQKEPDAPVKPIGEILVETQAIPQPIVEQALKKQEATKQKLAKEANYIRVDSNKLGHLINLVGELVISGAAMRLMVNRHGLTEVDEIVSTMEHLVEDIRDTALQLRMVQIGDTFSRFHRVVRDVSKDLGKQIELKITGGETELDKTVVEKINDPLTHLIRNSLDHGIEAPNERLAAGKPEKGVLHLNAFHDSGHIVIQVSDDGRGLDPEKIIAKAIAKGLIKPDQSLSRQEIFNLVFEPGLSTKDQASNLSGRGVGMDVVKRNIEALRGSVEIDSQPGVGTIVTIHLPLTLAIIDGFMVEAEKERYIIPLSMVEECVEMDSSEWEIDEIQHYISLRGEVLPYLRLGDFFHNRQRHTHTHRESLVVVRFGQTKAGFVVDELHGEHQTVIKPLGKVFQRIRGVSGATVLGSGEVALILDVQGLIQQALKHRARNPSLLNAPKPMQ